MSSLKQVMIPALKSLNVFIIAFLMSLFCVLVKLSFLETMTMWLLAFGEDLFS